MEAYLKICYCDQSADFQWRSNYLLSGMQKQSDCNSYCYPNVKDGVQWVKSD